MLILGLLCCRDPACTIADFFQIQSCWGLEEKKFRRHVLLHVSMLLIVPVSSDNIYEYPSRFQHASWRLWKSHVKLFRCVLFREQQGWSVVFPLKRRALHQTYGSVIVNLPIFQSGLLYAGKRNIQPCLRPVNLWTTDPYFLVLGAT